jgi:hypothetical protein
MGYNRPRFICLSSVTSGNTANDSTTYYLGGGYPSLTTVTSGGGFIMPMNGFIRMASITSYSATVTGTNEDWTFLIRNLTTTTDYPFVTVGAATATRVFQNNNLNIPVSVGDEIFFKTTTPAWATNPDGIIFQSRLFIEVE